MNQKSSSNCTIRLNDEFLLHEGTIKKLNRFLFRGILFISKALVLLKLNNQGGKLSGKGFLMTWLQMKFISCR